MFAVKHSPFDMVPQVRKRGEDGTQTSGRRHAISSPGTFSSRRYEGRLVFNHAGQFKEESASCIVKSFSAASE